MTPRVSLLVPVFNREDLLAECIESALNQTMPDLEVVVVDGASTDGTWRVCQHYAARDPRVRVFRDATNPGPALGWYRCIEEARGEFATFLWSDDLLMPEFLDATLPLLTEQVAFVVTSALIGRTPDSGVATYRHPSGDVPSPTYLREALLTPGSYPVSPAAALFRLDDLKRSWMTQLPTNPPVDLSQTGAGIDELLFLLTATRYPVVRCLAEPLSFFRFHPGSMTVEGRGGAVALGYALTERWFGAEFLGLRLRTDELARDWIRRLRRSNRIGPWVASRRYGNLISPEQLAVAGARLLLQRATRAGRSLAKRARHTPQA